MQDIRSTHSTHRAPEWVALLYEKRGDAPAECRALNFDGIVYDIPGDGPAIDSVGLNTISVRGRLYRAKRRLGERWTDYQTVEYGLLFALLQGWQVLVTYPNGETVPDFDLPLPDRATAALRAREAVTDNLAVYGTKLRAELVWQDGLAHGPEGVAGPNAENYRYDQHRWQG